MIVQVVCDRCKKQIGAKKAKRFGFGMGNVSSIVHIPGYDGEYFETFAYIDLCDECTQAFREFMKGGDNDA